LNDLFKKKIGCPKRVKVKEALNPRLVNQIPDAVVLNEEVSFTVSDVFNPNELKVKIQPQGGGDDLVPKITKLAENGECLVKWKPLEIGAYHITVECLGVSLIGGGDSSARVKVFDPTQVKVLSMMDGVANRPVSFQVDAAGAGEGQLEIGVTCAGQFVANQVKPVGYSKFEVQFVPGTAVAHMAEIKFNGHSIPGSPFQIRIASPSKLNNFFIRSTVHDTKLIFLAKINYLYQTFWLAEPFRHFNIFAEPKFHFSRKGPERKKTTFSRTTYTLKFDLVL
jgi:hypothetical protein